MATEQNINVNITATIESLTAGIEKVTEEIEGLSSPIKSAISAFAELGEAIVAAFAIERISEFAEKIAELGEKAINASNATGIAVEDISLLSTSFELAGGNADNFAQTLERLERSIALAESGSRRQAEALKSLGISMSDIAGKTPVEALRTLAEAFSRTAAGPQQVADAMALLRNASPELISWLQQLGSNFDEMTAKAKETQSVLDRPTAEALAKSAEGMKELGRATVGFAIEAFRIFKPEIDAIVNTITATIEAVTKLMKVWNDLRIFAKSAKEEAAEKPATAITTDQIDTANTQIKTQVSDLQERVKQLNAELAKTPEMLLTLKLAKNDEIARASEEIDTLTKKMDENNAIRERIAAGQTVTAKGFTGLDKGEEVGPKPAPTTPPDPAVIAANEALRAAEIGAEKTKQEALTKADEEGNLARLTAAKQAAEENLRLGKISQDQETAALQTNAKQRQKTEEEAAYENFDSKRRALTDTRAALEAEVVENEAAGTRKQAAIEKIDGELAANREAYVGRVTAAETKLQGDLTKIAADGAAKSAISQERVYNDRIKNANQTYTATVALLKQQVEIGQLTSDQETKQQTAAENERWNIVKANYDRISNLKISQTAKTTNKAAELAAEKAHQDALVAIANEGDIKSTQAYLAQSKDQIKTIDDASREEEARIKLKVQTGIFTEQQGTIALAEEEKKRIVLVSGVYDQELARGKFSVSERRNIEQQKSDAVAASNTKVTDLDTQAARQSSDAWIRSYDQRLKGIQEESKQEEGILRLRVATGEITEHQATSTLLSESQKRLAAIKAAYDEELRLGQFSVTEREAIEKRKTQAVAQAEAQIMALRSQEAQENRQLSDSIVSDFTSSLTSMLTTQETWNQRMINLANSLVNTFAQVLDRRLQDFIYTTLFETDAERAAAAAKVTTNTAAETAKTTTTVAQSNVRSATAVEEDVAINTSKVAEGVTHATIEVSKTGATVAGATERTAAEETSSEAGLGAEIAGAIKSITISAYEAAAGVYASVASIPFVGWILAPALAAAALATVLHFAGAFEEGSWDVPNTQLAQVHKGEMIIPSDVANAIRSNESAPFAAGLSSKITGTTNKESTASGGGASISPSVHFTINALDAASVTSLFKRNGQAMADIVVDKVRNSPSNMTKQVKRVAGPAY